MTKTLHNHNHNPSSRPHPLTSFFGCCLKDEPTPISPKIQALRNKRGEIKEVKINSKKSVKITSNMIVADLIYNFSEIKEYLNDIHPLGMLSPALETTTLELFLADLPNTDIQKTCQKMTELLKNHNGAIC